MLTVTGRRRGLDPDQHRSHFEHIAFGATRFDDPAVKRARDFHLGLGGLHRAQRLIELDVIADGDVPAGQRHLFEALAKIGDPEGLDPLIGGHSCPSERSTQSSSRSGPGSHNLSKRAGG